MSDAITFELSEEEFYRLNEESGGFCRTCGEEAYGVEPDARNYECESCEANQVFGAEELLMMGEIEIKPGE